MIGVLFDFNGVLFEDSHIHERAWNEFIRCAAGREITLDELRQFVHGRQNRSALRYVFGDSLLDTDAASFSEQKEAIYRDLCNSGEFKVELTPGTKKLFDFLKSNDIPNTIVTSACKSNVDFYFDIFQLHQWFEPDLVVFDDGVIPGKPDPAPYLEGAARIGLPISRCIVIEDSVSGVAASRAAGAHHVAGFGPPELEGGLIAAGADSVFSRFTDNVIQKIVGSLKVEYVKD